MRGRRTKPWVGKLIAFNPLTWVSRLREAVMKDWIALITWSEVCAMVPTTPRRAMKTAVRKVLKNFIVVVKIEGL